MIPQSVRPVGCEDVEELVQDATAIAARMLESVETAGKRVTPGNLAYYTVAVLKSGRRSTGSSTTDVIAVGAQLKGRTRLTSLEEVVASDLESGEEIFTFHDVLSRDQEDPATQAARELDWSSFSQTQPLRSRAILQYLAAGLPLTELAKRHRVPRSTLQANKDALARELKAFMGEDILREATRLPLWKNNLAVGRAKSAGKKTGRG